MVMELGIKERISKITILGVGATIGGVILVILGV